MRLIAAPFQGKPSFLSAGVEIELAPGTLTYWRMPGSSGVPPVFSFAGSQNLRDAKVLYPAPTRIDEAGTDVFGYLGNVIFPLHITPEDPERPVALAMALTYAVCERVCVPVKASTKLVLRAGETDSGTSSQHAATIAAAEAKVPLRLTDAERDRRVTISNSQGAPASWRLSVRDGPAQDLFAEAPDGWFFETSKAGSANEFLIVAAEAPKASQGTTVPVTFTLTGTQQSYEFEAELDAAPEPRENAFKNN